MRLRLLLALLAAGALAAPAHATAVKRPPVTWLKGEGNYTKAHRSPKAIRQVVVHVTEGPFWPSIRWLRSGRSHASSHYVVSRSGGIVQLVHQSDIAWHAGNWAVNVRSVGIEHEGVVNDPAGFTRAQYDASARLAAYIARRSLIPIDRSRFIGHSEVPHPSRAGVRGGFDGHTDPGPRWNWRLYLRLVRKYAFPARPKPARVTIERTNLRDRQLVKGAFPWRAKTSGPVRLVEVRVDGKLLLRDRSAPFGGTWDTRRVANGRRVVELRAYGPRGATSRARVVVRVRNAPLAVAARAPREVTGVLPLRPRVTGGSPKVVRLLLDGRPVARAAQAPYAFAWDSTRTPNGRHVLELRVTSRDGRTASRRLPVRVVNPVVAEQAVVDGVWTVVTRGRVERVELLVGGELRATLTSAPYAWPLDLPAGEHALTARAVAPDGTAAEDSLLFRQG